MNDYALQEIRNYLWQQEHVRQLRKGLLWASAICIPFWAIVIWLVVR